MKTFSCKKSKRKFKLKIAREDQFLQLKKNVDKIKRRPFSGFTYNGDYLKNKKHLSDNE